MRKAISFEAVSVAHGKRPAIIQVRPQVTFRPDRIYIPIHIATFFDVEDIIIGHNSQKISIDALPGWSFSQCMGDEGEEDGRRFDMDIVNPNQYIILKVINKSSHSRAFQATIFGEEIRR